MPQEIKMISFNTHLKPHPLYYYGNRIIDELGKLIQKYTYDKVYFVTNDILMENYMPEIVDMFKRHKIEHNVTSIKYGEDHKNFGDLEQVCDIIDYKAN